MDRFFKATISFILIMSLTLLVGLFILPRFFGYNPYMVASGSMAKVYPVGSLIYVKSATPDDIEVGDPIMYSLTESVVTHRVISKDDVKRVFVTKGDNNNVSEVVTYDQLRGKATQFSIPKLGYLSVWISTVNGKLILCGYTIVLIVMELILGKMIELDSDENNERKEE